MEEARRLNIHLRVLDEKKKSKFLHFDLIDVPQFTYPEELKQYLIDNHENVVQPARSTNFKLGYFIDGRGNKKFDIVDRQTLQLAYKTQVTGRINIWIDPHEAEVMPQKNKEKTKKKRKRERRLPSSTDQEDGEDDVPDKSKKKTEVQEKFRSLQMKHAGKWPDYKLRAWANMLVVGTHLSEDEPPSVPYFREEGLPKKSQRNSMAETVAAAVAASVSTLGTGSQKSASAASNVEVRGQLLRQLKDLKQLLDDGVLTEIEYSNQKEQILKEMSN